jgi:hypothetical protein
MNVVEAISESLSSTFNGFAAFIPKLFGALIILLIGWLIARAIKFALSKVLKAVNFDSITEKVGINGYMAKAGLKSKGSDMIAKLGYWIVMLTVLILFFDSLGLPSVSGLLRDGVNFIPKIMVACILLVIGMYIAQFASGLAEGTLKAGGFSNPGLVAKIVYGAIMFLVVTIALDKLDIGSGILDNILSIVLGALGLGLSIAFGLGGVDWAKKTISNISK